MLRLVSLLVFSLVAIGGTYAVRVGDTPVLPATAYDYEGIGLPRHLDENWVVKWDNTPEQNPITNAGATLGRVLFYDVRLSRNGTVSCATCHQQDHGFSDPEALSVGFQGERTSRNSMALAFARYDSNRRFFWDARARTLEQLILEPIQDPIEMGMTLDELTARLEATDFYPGLFADAFGTPEITPDRISRAVSQFIRSIVASDSRYDVARQAEGAVIGRPLAGFTDQENQGLQLFFTVGCNDCHAGDLFMGTGTMNNGLNAELTDPRTFQDRFKTVSLRNIELTAPYMHDGRFATLEEVVEHYDTGVQHSPGLDPRLLGLDGPRRRNFSDEEKAALVAFLNTLTDPTLATDPRWSNPFPADESVPEVGSEDPQFERMGPHLVREKAEFRLRLASPAEVKVEVSTSLGSRVATLLDGTREGDVTVTWDASNAAPGTYVVRLDTGDIVRTHTVAVPVRAGRSTGLNEARETAPLDRSTGRIQCRSASGC